MLIFESKEGCLTYPEIRVIDILGLTVVAAMYLLMEGFHPELSGPSGLKTLKTDWPALIETNQCGLWVQC